MGIIFKACLLALQCNFSVNGLVCHQTIEGESEVVNYKKVSKTLYMAESGANFTYLDIDSKKIQVVATVDDNAYKTIRNFECVGR